MSVVVQFHFLIIENPVVAGFATYKEQWFGDRFLRCRDIFNSVVYLIDQISSVMFLPILCVRLFC